MSSFISGMSPFYNVPTQAFHHIGFFSFFFISLHQSIISALFPSPSSPFYHVTLQVFCLIRLFSTSRTWDKFQTGLHLLHNWRGTKIHLLSCANSSMLSYNNLSTVRTIIFTFALAVSLCTVYFIIYEINLCKYMPIAQSPTANVCPFISSWKPKSVDYTLCTQTAHTLSSFYSLFSATH